MARLHLVANASQNGRHHLRFDGEKNGVARGEDGAVVFGRASARDVFLKFNAGGVAGVAC
jgi:hypothetical protein